MLVAPVHVDGAPRLSSPAVAIKRVCLAPCLARHRSDHVCTTALDRPLLPLIEGGGGDEG